MNANTSSFVSVLAVAVVASFGFAPAAHAQSVVRCESRSNDRTWCVTDTRAGVRINRQLSSQGCWEGQTWGHSGRGIWVANGCRADFTVYGGARARSSSSGENVALGLLALGVVAAVANNNNRDNVRYNDNRYSDDGDWDGRNRGNNYGYYSDYGAPVRTIICESVDGRRTYCEYPIRRADVQLYRQLSRSNCQYGYSWGWDRRGIWTSNGCRGEFGIYPRRG